jgi:hypothetical protein
MRLVAFPILIILIGYASAGDQASRSAENKTIRGWLSDEMCAKGRASSGVFTGTNPMCAKECVWPENSVARFSGQGFQERSIRCYPAARLRRA